LPLLRDRLLTPAWTVVGGLYGTAAQLKIARRAVSDALGGIGKLTFLDDGRVRLLGRITRIWKKSLHWPLLPGVFRRIFGSSLQKIEAIPHLYSIMKGEPGEFILGFAYFKDRKERPSVDLDPARDGAGMLWLAVLCPLTGTHTNDLLQLCEPVFNKHGFDLSVVFIVVNPRSTLALMEIFYDKQDAAEGQREIAPRTLPPQAENPTRSHSAKLKEVTDGLRQRMHQPIPVQGVWLRQSLPPAQALRHAHISIYLADSEP
jgi:hypothetical protein